MIGTLTGLYISSVFVAGVSSSNLVSHHVCAVRHIGQRHLLIKRGSACQRFSRTVALVAPLAFLAQASSVHQENRRDDVFAQLVERRGVHTNWVLDVTVLVTPHAVSELRLHRSIQHAIRRTHRSQQALQHQQEHCAQHKVLQVRSVLTLKPLQRLTERWDFFGVASVELAAVMVTGSQPRTTGSAKILHFVRIDVSVNATTERFEKILVCALWCALQPRFDARCQLA